MIHNEKIQRGAIDKSFIAIKCTFHKEMTHSEVLTKCVEYVWEGKMGTYYLGDGSGCKIPDKDLTIRIKEKENKLVPWNLGSYVKACNTYASRTRLYCVRVGKTFDY